MYQIEDSSSASKLPAVDRDNEWPFYVRIIVSSSKDKASACSGVLIGPDLVLTSAHCVVEKGVRGYRTVNPKFVDVFAGLIDINDRSKPSLKAKSICYSKDRFSNDNEGNVEYDYAFIKLTGRFEISDSIKYACLPFGPIDLENTDCYLIGAGLVKKNGLLMPPKRIVRMQTSSVSCKPWNIRESDRARLCFEKKRDSNDRCQEGDSGSPVLCRGTSNRYQVVGMVSYGGPKCEPKTFKDRIGVYANIRYMLKNMQSNCASSI